MKLKDAKIAKLKELRKMMQKKMLGSFSKSESKNIASIAEKKKEKDDEDEDELEIEGPGLKDMIKSFFNSSPDLGMGRGKGKSQIVMMHGIMAKPKEGAKAMKK